VTKTKGKIHVRCVYLDEAGLGDERDEPITVVAAVLVHADQQWRPLEADIQKIIERLVPLPSRQGFEFHAKELFSGSKSFPWSKAVRHAILAEFAALFQKHRLPILTGASVRAQIRQLLETKNKKVLQKHLDLAAHNFAFLDAARKVDFVLRTLAPNEVGMCFADETVFQRKDWLRTTLDFFRKMSLTGNLGDRFEHFVDTLYFAASHESLGLQLADSAAFLFKRHLMAKKDSEPFYKLIEPCVMLDSGPHMIKREP
jgi:hypothetical protein